MVAGQTHRPVKAFRKVLVIFVAGAVLVGLARRGLESAARRPALARLLMPFRMAALMAEPPDPKIAMPLKNVPPRYIANTWHADRPGGRLHEGQDIFAPSGAPVYSATNGIVIRMGSAGIGGNAVSVMGAGGRVYYYAHLSRFAEGLRIGEDVTPATVLGYVGNTGNARTTPSHLHFGIYGPGGAINPLPLLAAPGESS